MTSDRTFTCTAPVWFWKSSAKPEAAGWFFATIDPQTAAEIKYATMGMSRGFGSVKVVAQVGATRWATSLFPHKESGGFILPVKASVRKAEGVDAGDVIAVVLNV